MNKTEKRKEITKRFLTYITEQFPQYEICDDGDGGRMYFYLKGGDNDESIEYHRTNGLYAFNWATDLTKENLAIMEDML